MPESPVDQSADEPRSAETVSIVVTGDLVLDVERADHWLSGIAPVLGAADVAIGHLEVPHTLQGTELKGDVPAPGAPPENLDALGRAGFTLVTLAGNHIADRGAVGIADTIGRLDQLGIAHTGAGADLARARAPATLDVRGRRIAVLSYNCVGPESAWATPQRAGCNYLRIGLPPKALEKAGSFGLRGLSERARRVGGWIDVSPGERGTCVLLSIPLADRTAEAAEAAA